MIIPSIHLNHIRKLCLTIVGVSLASTGWASQEMERVIEQSVDAWVQKHDRYAMSRASIVYKKIVAPLAGTSLEVEDFFSPVASGTFESSDIQSIRIQVFSSLPLDTWTQSKIKDIQFFGTTPQFTFEIIPEETVVLLRLNRLKENLKMTELTWSELWTNHKDNFVKYGGIAYGALILSFLLIFLIGISVSTISRGRQTKAAVGELIPLFSKLSDEGGLGGGRFASPVSAPQDSFGPAPFESRNDGKPTYSTAVLLRLFCDAYWCQQDAYAHALWKQVPSEQKQDLVGTWPYEKHYFEFILGINPKGSSHQDHPRYLRDMPYQHCSNDQLKALVLKTPGLWADLSPMRRATLDLNLDQRIRLEQEPQVDAKVSQFPQGTLRKIPRTQSLGHIEFADEDRILDQPDLIPDSLRARTKSLVWLALCSPAHREEVLRGFAAQELATAWWGSERVLSALEESLPPKKLQLLKSYLQKTSPSLLNPIYDSLAAKGVTLLADSGPSTENNHLADEEAA